MPEIHSLSKEVSRIQTINNFIHWLLLKLIKKEDMRNEKRGNSRSRKCPPLSGQAVQKKKKNGKLEFGVRHSFSVLRSHHLMDVVSSLVQAIFQASAIAGSSRDAKPH